MVAEAGRHLVKAANNVGGVRVKLDLRTTGPKIEKVISKWGRF
jgi:hypothetical protein